jgi:hypothetical protein
MPLPYTLPFTFLLYIPPRERTCHVLHQTRTVTVLANPRTFVIPDEPPRMCHMLNTVRSVGVLPNQRTFVVPDNE